MENPGISIEIVYELQMRGTFSELVLPKPVPRTEPLSRYAEKKSSPSPRPYSGLIIDARGTGARPALAPRILNEQGDEAYSVAYVEDRKEADIGIIAYVTTLEQANSHPRVGKTLMMLKALRATGSNSTDIVLADVDIETLHLIPEYFNFLKQAKVVAVLDPT